MKLPTLPFLKKPETQNYYLALLLRDDRAHAIIFEEKLGKINVLGRHEERFPAFIEDTTAEDFLTILDKTISLAESKLPENIVTHKTIFGLKENWIENGSIKESYKNKLKKACEELALTPIGFMEVHEAIAHLLQKEEGAPISAILVEVGAKDTAISLVRAGKIIETKRTTIEDSVVKTTDRLLHHFTNYEVLPSRIILFDGKNIEPLGQEFIAHQWSKSLPFLHVPQVTTLPKDYDAKAVLFGTALQMGFDVDTKPAPIQRTTEQEIAIKKGQEKEKIGDDDLTDQNLPTADDEKDQETEQQQEPDTDEQADEAQTFGFVKNQDIAKNQAKGPIIHPGAQMHEEEKYKKISSEDLDLNTFAPVTRTEVSEEEGEKAPIHTSSSPIGRIPNLTSVFTRFTAVFKKKSAPTPSGKRKIPIPLLLIPPILVILGIILVIFYFTSVKATVTLSLASEKVDQTKAVSFTAEEKTDLASNTIHADQLTVSKDGSVSTNATGKKEVGDKAKGSVKISSSQTSDQTVAKGTTITASNGLEFVTDNEVKIASSSGVSDIKTVSVNVTASDVGKEYNLPSDITFSVGNYDKSSVQAKNDNAFSGGSKKEVTVVAKADIAKLEKDLTDQLEGDAKDALTNQLSSDQTLLPVFTDTAVSKRTLSKDIGDEATSTTLKATVTYTALAYRKSDIDDLIADLLKGKLDTMTIKHDATTYDVSDAKVTSDKQVDATIAVNAGLLPKIDQDKLKEDIAGKSFTDAIEYLKHVSDIADANIMAKPNLPLLPKFLPKNPANISITIAQ